MKESEYIPVILGTARKGRNSEKVAKFIINELKKEKIKTELIDVKDYRINATDNSGKIPQAIKWRKKLEKCKKFIIVSPEYNHGYPGELKMFLDMLYHEYAGKKVGLVTLSGGPFAGVRADIQLKTLTVALGMSPMLKTLSFSNINDVFDTSGNLKDEAYLKRAKLFISNLKKFK